MRELLFKNMTSLEKKRKTLSIQEVKQQKGFLTRINRKYIYIIKNSDSSEHISDIPQLYIVKERDSKEQTEKLLFKVKGNFQVVYNEHIFLVYFCHSLKIILNNYPLKNSPQKY